MSILDTLESELFAHPERAYSIYVRTDRHVQWKYAQYCGRWETPEKAIEVAKERMGNVTFDYMIESMDDPHFKMKGTINAE